MDDPAEAPVAARESIRETNTMPPSTHDNAGDICTDEGRTEEVHKRTVSHTHESNAIQPPTTKRFSTFAVDTGLTDSPGLPPELRLRVYKAAFPEMDRPIVDQTPSYRISDPKRVFIGAFRECQGDCDLDYCLDCYLHFRVRWNNRLREAFTSNFARDPTTRIEFLTEYLRRVRIFKQMEGHTGDRKANLYLWRFLSILATSGLIGEMKHLTIEANPGETRCLYSSMKGAIRETSIGHIFAVLFRFRVNCELWFEVSPTYKPILDRIAEIVKANLSRDEIDKYFTSDCSDPYHHQYFTVTNELFSKDATLLKLIDRFNKWEQKSYSNPRFLTKYPIDFSE